MQYKVINGSNDVLRRQGVKTVLTRRPLMWIVVGGLIAGAGDISFACIYWELARAVPPERILQSVATGLLGRASYDGGWNTALLGLALHFFIALAMSGAYYAASLRITILERSPIAMGALYGLVLYPVMTFVVVPLSNAAFRGVANDLWTWLSILAHMLLVGIPIAVSVSQISNGGNKEHDEPFGSTKSALRGP